MNDIFHSDDDASTALTVDEVKGLRLTYITTRGELNRAEQKNITKARLWAFKRSRNILDIDFLKDLHKRMFSDVWSWAGKYRTTERNIGINAFEISVALYSLIEDVKIQIKYNSYSPQEICSRFHVRLVSIHPWSNGNGRHGRLATDLLAKQMNIEPFLWGNQNNLSNESDIRKEYISAIRYAETHDDFSPMIAFMLGK